MSTVLPRNPVNPRPGLPTYEEPSVARFIVVPGSDSGFLVPDGRSTANDRHIQGLDAPGLVRTLPAVLYFRTRFSAGVRFSVRVNASSEFQFHADQAGARSWHELLSPGVLREKDNEMVLSIASDTDGEVVFSEIAILYTSNKLTVTRPIVLDPHP